MRGSLRWVRRLAVALGLVLLAAALVVAPDLTRMDYRHLGSRASWQVPDRVLESLQIQSGDAVADIGAGDGYFTFRLAEAVGPGGTVFAVEVDDDLVAELERKARDGGFENVVVVRGQYDDPLLPDDGIDLAFLCNSYHHIEGRTGYFERLRRDLAEGGRVALIDMRASPLVRLLVPADHWTTVETMTREMGGASYTLVERFDDLPVQDFAIFRPATR